jgi:hypothetical protein
VGTDSRYRVKTGGTSFISVDADWCGSQWCGTTDGTGYYEGSYYTYTQPTATLSSTTPLIKSSYLGKAIVDSGINYVYWDPSTQMRNDNNVYGDNGGLEPIAAGDPAPPPAAPPAAAAPTPPWPPSWTPPTIPAKARAMAFAILGKMDKAGLGGLAAEGFTPTGCALGFGGSCRRHRHQQCAVVPAEGEGHRSAELPQLLRAAGDRRLTQPRLRHRLQLRRLLQRRSQGGRCTCQAVKSAQDLQAAGITTFVVGFSNAVTDPYTRATLNNIAKAGGTSNALFAVQEGQLRDQLVSAIYQAAQGSYSTSPASSSSGVRRRPR